MNPVITSLLAQVTNPVIGPLGSPENFGGNLARIIATILRFVLVIGSLLFLIFLVISGVNWLTSEGDPKKIEQARNQLINAVTGLVILAAALAIASFVGRALGIDFLTSLDINIPTVNQ